jgi:DNA-binding HxlR family transcriptional regulator
MLQVMTCSAALQGCHAAVKKKSTPEDGRFAYEGLDRVLHERARLAILTSLATRPQGMRFQELKRRCALTDGNLSRHLNVLHDAGIVQIAKAFEGRRPRTTCRLTAEGRRRFTAYLAQLEQVIKDARSRS